MDNWTRFAQVVFLILDLRLVAGLAGLACLTALLQWHYFRDNLRGSALGMAIAWGQIAVVFVWMLIEGEAIILPARAWLRMALVVLALSQIMHNGGAWALLCRQATQWIYAIGDRWPYRP